MDFSYFLHQIVYLVEFEVRFQQEFDATQLSDQVSQYLLANACIGKTVLLLVITPVVVYDLLDRSTLMITDNVFLKKKYIQVWIREFNNDSWISISTIGLFQLLRHTRRTWNFGISVLLGISHNES